MKKYSMMILIGLLSLGLFACGSEEDWAAEINDEVSEELTETALRSVESELAIESERAIPDRLKYKCFCDVSNHSCGPDYPFPVVKKSTCRYKRSTGKCVGKCMARCADGASHIERGSEFKGRCKRRLIRPDGTIFEEVFDCDKSDLVQDSTER